MAYTVRRSDQDQGCAIPEAEIPLDRRIAARKRTFPSIEPTGSPSPKSDVSERFRSLGPGLPFADPFFRVPA
jgi:hypothetical protein